MQMQQCFTAQFRQVDIVFEYCVLQYNTDVVASRVCPALHSDMMCSGTMGTVFSGI